MGDSGGELGNRKESFRLSHRLLGWYTVIRIYNVSLINYISETLSSVNYSCISLRHTYWICCRDYVT